MILYNFIGSKKQFMIDSEFETLSELSKYCEITNTTMSRMLNKKIAVGRTTYESIIYALGNYYTKYFEKIEVEKKRPVKTKSFNFVSSKEELLNDFNVTSQLKLAAKLGLSDQYIYKLLNKKVNININFYRTCEKFIGDKVKNHFQEV